MVLVFRALKTETKSHYHMTFYTAQNFHWQKFSVLARWQNDENE